ncbi:hypothetical protein [Legionella nagasakiensis]|uniref:hypothetical protein n=1 Tax=Legionella nagasakiensis TaxID=535290 RepID=UPI00105622AE|nr:hypothetical protein [Legionella nagasakiensis]
MTIKSAIEVYLAYLKQAKLSSALDKIHRNIITSLQNRRIFSEELSHYFGTSIDAEFEYRILADEPSRVVTLKKLLNAIFYVKNSLSKLEKINLQDTDSDLAFYKNIIQACVGTVDGIYLAMRQINHSSIEMKVLIEPQLSQILLRLDPIVQSLKLVANDSNSTAAGRIFVSLIHALPDEKAKPHQGTEFLGHLLIQLPQYFAQLQALMVVEPIETITSEDYQRRMNERALKLTSYFVDVAEKGNLLTLIPSYLKIMVLLIKHSTDLMNTAAPLTKHAYLEAVVILNKIRHELLPQLLSELEGAEENMGLQSGLISEPIFKHLEHYYFQLASRVNEIAGVAGVLDHYALKMNKGTVALVRRLVGSDRLDVGEAISPASGLTTLRDDEFVTTARESKIARLIHAQQAYADYRKSEKAAERFFMKLKSYSKLSQAGYRWSLANLSSDDKQQLLKEYRLIRPYFSIHHPMMDKLIIEALTKINKGNFFQRFYNSDFKQVWGENQFKQVLSCEKSIMIAMMRSKADALLKVNLVKHSLEHRDRLLYGVQDTLTPLNESAPPFVTHEFDLEKGKPAEFYRQTRITVLIELYKLQSAEEGLLDFFEYIQNKFPDSDPELRNLDEDDKEKLRHLYKAFQTHVQYLNPVLNKRIVEVLTHSSSSDSLRTTDLESMILEPVEGHLKKYIKHYEKDVFVCKKMAQQAQQELPAPIEQTTPKLNTILAHIRVLNLSEKIKDFIQKTLKDVLKENLEPGILEHLSAQELPYQELHRDPEEVAMYKRLFNAFFYIRQGLAKLESFDVLEEMDDSMNDDDRYLGYGIYRTKLSYEERLVRTGNRAGYLLSRAYMLTPEFYNAFLYLKAAAENPALNPLVRDALQLLTPLQDIPIIGGHLCTLSSTQRQATEAEKPFDMIALWEERQAFITKELSSSGTTTAPSEKAMLSLSETFEAVNEIFLGLDDLLEEQSVESLMDRKEVFVAWYAKLYQYLPGDNSFGPEYIARISDSKAMHDALNELQQIRIENVQKYQLYHSGDAEGPVVLETVSSAAKASHDSVRNFPNAQEFYIKKVMEKLYQVSRKLQQINSPNTDLIYDEEDIQGRMSALMNVLRDLSFGPGSLKNILRLIDDLYKILVEIGIESRHLILDRTQEFSVALATKLLTVTDDSEYQLGLKPGALSEKLAEKFNNFYEAFIQNLPVQNEHERLRMAIGAEVTRNRFRKEQERLQYLISDSERQRTKARIFSSPEYFEEINTHFMELDSLLEHQESPMVIKGELVGWYAKLYPYLPETFDVSYLANVSDERAMYRALSELQQVRLENVRHYQVGSFKKLEALYQEYQDYDPKLFDFSSSPSIFESIAVKHEFLRCYQDIQPYLYQIDPALFDTTFYLGMLRTNEDFEQALVDIIGRKDKLEELVASKTSTQVQRVRRCEKRIAYLEQQLTQEELDEAALQTIAAAKESCYQLLNQIEIHKFGNNDIEMNKFIETKKKEISQANDEQLNEIQKSLRGVLNTFQQDPVIKAVRDAITMLRRGVRFYTIQKNMKADRIERAMSHVPLEQRGLVDYGETKETNDVLGALASHRHLGKRGRVYLTKEHKIDEQRAAKTYTFFKNAVGKHTTDIQAAKVRDKNKPL